MRLDPIAALAESWGREMDSAPCDRVARFATPAADRIEAAAIAKRARRAAKRADDERRTDAGRAPLWVRLRPRRAFWDWCEWRIRNGEWHVRNGSTIGEPRWRIRARERRALPGMERPWSLSKQPRIKGLSLGWVRRIDAKRVRLAELAWSEHAGVPCDPR